jgi:ATP-dependent Clp protease ATP-binding subunit ClpC
VFERFTEHARHVVSFAQEEARLLKHGAVGNEHLLLGLLREGEGLGGRALQGAGLWLDATRAAATARYQENGGASRQVPFTAEAKRVLERALREALRLGHNYVGTEHLLLGLLRDEPTSGLLSELGAEPETVREQLLGLIAQRPERRQLPYAPDVSAALGRATESARVDGAEQVELRHLKQVLEGS